MAEPTAQRTDEQLRRRDAYRIIQRENVQRRGFATRKTRVTWQDVMEADEVLSTGNYGKVLPITRIENCNLQFGP